MLTRRDDFVRLMKHIIGYRKSDPVYSYSGLEEKIDTNHTINTNPFSYHLYT